MNTTDPVLLPHATSAPEGDAIARWRLRLHAVDEPLLLSRILQKITVPEIELRSAHYEIDGPSGIARIELTLFSPPGPGPAGRRPAAKDHWRAIRGHDAAGGNWRGGLPPRMTTFGLVGQQRLG